MKGKRQVEYMFPNILAEMGRHGDNLRTLSEKIGLSYQSLSKRLRGQRNFELDEINKIIILYQQPYDILFKKKVK